jgi:hypothetical protein
MPGKFPHIIGGYWGEVFQVRIDRRRVHRRSHDSKLRGIKGTSNEAFAADASKIRTLMITDHLAVITRVRLRG